MKDVSFWRNNQRTPIRNRKKDFYDNVFRSFQYKHLQWFFFRPFITSEVTKSLLRYKNQLSYTQKSLSVDQSNYQQISSATQLKVSLCFIFLLFHSKNILLCSCLETEPFLLKRTNFSRTNLRIRIESILIQFSLSLL